ncbi:flocculation protein FLO11, partial [Biomphalaria pfeifferi]
MTWSRDFSFPLVICLVLIITTVSNSQVITGVRPSTPNQATASRVSALCPTGWLPASVPKPGYDLITNQLCLKLNLPERRWADAVDQCRMSRGFMVKLDSIVMVKETPLFDYLRQRDVSSVWSGMHHKYGTLLWDDLHPKMVKVYIGENEPYGWRKRSYAFDQSSYVLGDKTCGYLTLATNQTSKSNKLDKRLRRSPGDLTVRPSEVPKPKDKAQPDKPVNLHVDHDDSPTKAQPTSGQKKAATPRVLSNTTTQSTTTDQSDQEDNEHPGPTTLHPPFPGETTSKPTTPQKQSAKGTSLPSSTLALTTAEPFGFPSLIDTLYNPSSDMSLDSSPLSDFGTQKEVQVGRKDKRLEVAFDTKIPNARLPKGANSSERIESKEQVSPSWLKSVTNSKQNSTSVASPVTTVNPTQASTTPSTASKPITMASTLDKATIKLSQSLDITTAAISTSTTTAPSNAEVQTTKSTKALETTTTDSESSKENSDSASNESGTTVNSLANIQNSTADQTTGPTSGTTTYADTSTPVETTNWTTTTATTTQSTDSITTTTEATSTLTQTTELTKPPQVVESTTTPPTQNQEVTTSQQAQDSINKPTQTQDSLTTSTQNQTSITTPAQASEHLTLTQTSKASEAVESTTRAPTTPESVLLSSFTGTVQNDSLSASIKQNFTASTETMSNMSKGEVSSSAESQDSSQEQVATLDDDIFPMQSYLNLLLPSTKQQHQVPSTTGRPSSSTDSQESSEERDFFAAMRATVPSPPADVMSLGDCNEEKASLCFTEAIDQLSLVSHCERNWYGHRLLDRCYKPLTVSVTEMEAKQQCLRQSGSLAAGDTDFYGNVTAILQDMLVANKMAGKRIWLDTSLNLHIPGGNGLCSALENGQISRVSCSSRLAVICQKDAQFVRTLEDFRDKLEVITYIQNMTSFQPQTLPCPLGMTAFDDVIVWFKDGRPIDDLKDDDSTSFGPKNGQLPNSLELDLSILKRIGETSPVYLKPPMLQGEYWCEIWRKAPFRRIPSNKIYIKFTDVITLRGVIFTEPISYTDAAIFNRMGQKVGVPAAMEMRLSIMNKNITNYLRGILPIIRDIITFIKRVSADEGQSEFVTYISTSTGDLPPHMRGNVADLYLSAFFEALVLNDDVIRTEWNLTLSFTKAVSVSMTDLCPEKILVDPKTNFSATFPSTPVNTQTYSRDYCNNAYSGNAYCKGNLQTGAYWDSWTISHSCLLLNVSAPVPGSALNGPTNERVKNTSADGASTKLPNVITVPGSAMLDPDSVKPLVDDVSTSVDLLTQVLNQTTNLTDLDIHTVAHLVNNIASVNVPPREVGQMLIQTVNKILDAPPEVLLKAEEESHAPS